MKGLLNAAERYRPRFDRKYAEETFDAVRHSVGQAGKILFQRKKSGFECDARFGEPHGNHHILTKLIWAWTRRRGKFSIER